jgi:predicted transposase YbfD/YdcC
MINAFSEIEDPRIERTRQHNLVDIITVALCATIAGAEGYNEIEDWGRAKYWWLRKFLSLPNKIPSHDTFNRVFSMLDPAKFQAAFLSWIESVNMLLDDRIISIDGKTMRRSFDKVNNKRALHLVSAWACEAQLSLGQIQVDKKSNEITAIPLLLDQLFLKGAIVTLDAMGSQKNIAKQIIDKKADYVLALKKNHCDLYDDVDTYFKNENEAQFVTTKTIGKDHGRIEKRVYRTMKNISWLMQKNEWKNLQTIAQVTSSRTTFLGEETSTRYYLTSLSIDKFDLICKAIRSHWKIENSLHWCLDVIFSEDQSRIRDKNAAQNIAFLRKMAISILKKDKSKNISLKRKRFMAGIEEGYLSHLLSVRPA